MISEVRRIDTPSPKTALRHVLPRLTDDCRLTAAAMAADRDTAAYAQALDPGIRLVVLSLSGRGAPQILLEREHGAACISGIALRPDGEQLVHVEWEAHKPARMIFTDLDPANAWKPLAERSHQLALPVDNPRHLRWYNNRYFQFSDYSDGHTYVYDTEGGTLIDPTAHGLDVADHPD